MTAFTRVFTLMGLTATLVATSPVWAEAAPVYDADTMQQQFESAGEPSPAPEPPAPTAVQDNTFMPVPATPAVVAPPPAAAAQPSVSPNLGTAALTPDQRLKRVEQQLNTLQSNDLSARTESLQTQVQTLRGQVEQLTHQLEQVQAQQKSQYSDLDKRLSNAPAPSAAPAPLTSDSTPDAAPAPAKSKAKTAAAKAEAKNLASAATSAQPAQPDGAEEQKIYQTAYDLIKAKKYTQAVTTLQGMLQKYPSGQFASNAHYWLGELYGLLGKNDQALVEFATVVKSFPDSPRVSDAQLKVGLIYAAQNQWPDAKLAFKKVASNYSGTPSARLAAEQLKQLKQAGH